MRNIILFDDEGWESLLPICFTKPAALIRVGILTIQEKWEHYLEGEASFITQDFLSEKYPINIKDDNWVISGRLLPNESLVRLIKNLKQGEAYTFGDHLLAARINEKQFHQIVQNDAYSNLNGTDLKTLDHLIDEISLPQDIFKKNAQEIDKDFDILTKDKTSQVLPEEVSTKGSRIFVEQGAKLEYARLNASTGSIYIGKNAKILDGAILRGPIALGESSVVKMGAKIYGPTSVGPWCKVGGEIKNCVFQSYSNKGHDGYLGDSVIGSFCNLGADTNCSNLKNNYSEVKLWSYPKSEMINSGETFVGLFMGDHSKCGINTMFNTGTTVGVCCNIFGPGFPAKFLPSFSWGGSDGFQVYDFEKCLETMKKVMLRRNIELTELDVRIFKTIFQRSMDYHQS